MRKAETSIRSFKPVVTGIFLAVVVMLAGYIPGNENIVQAASLDKPGYILTFQEEFNGNSVDLSKWNDWDINFGNREPGIVTTSNDFAYCPENVRVSGGCLRITASRNPITAAQCGGGTRTVNYRTGEINTKNKFQQTYGWFEARIKLPKARALYPGFWLMPAEGVGMIDENGGAGAEVDIMEYETYWMGNQVTSSIWYGGYGSNLQGGGIGSTYSPISDANDWHVYALNWEPGKLEIYVDGVKTQEHTGEGVPYGDEIIILSMAVASWGKPCLDSELPDAMLVDYVRVYQKASHAARLQSGGQRQQGTPSGQDATTMVVNDSHPCIIYAGSWMPYNNPLTYRGDFHYSKTLLDTYIIPFVGKRLRAYGLKDRWCGMVAVFVDNKLLKTVDCYSPKPAAYQLLYDTGNLPYGEHTVMLVNLRQKNPEALGYYHYADEFRIYR
ncbi:MAG TPA: glycoside hydrolase family 16 protein [Peptococcaceae bacterium]|nr:glycoside hydrolase family 16 protein [Peptococcaceae bacterium]HPZ70760.1 glycoside hydrolase family 16 protein [Peptococcaceae bacterium]HQD54380.1 glycoside hydrolase family 16 protein [Peptococcaceae bacterium]